MKTTRTDKFAKARVKISKQETLAKAFGRDRQQIKSFTDEDKGEDRRFETSLSGFRYVEEKHEASRYLSRTAATVTVKVKLGNPVFKSREKIVDKALVDTGSTFTVLPRSIANKLGLRSLGKRRVETANRSQLLDQSFASIEVDGKNTVTPLLISGTLDKILIGVITLEALGLMVDPTKGTLKDRETSPLNPTGNGRKGPF
jgi:clan AA aspartic protease